MTEPKFDQAIYRLAQYRPFNNGGRDVAAALGDLVLSAAVVEGSGFGSLAACATAISTLWGLKVETDELREVVDRLVEDGLAERQGGGLVLTKAAIARQEQVAVESEAIEADAMADWRATIAAQVPDLSKGEWDELCTDLRSWLGQVISRHGVESALILYPENPRAQEVFDSIEQIGLSFLPTHGDRVDQMRDWAFQQFVRSPTAAQRTYLAGLLNTSFYLTVLTLDPQASQLVQEQVTGQRVYLDTNFIYALLGLGVTATETLSAARLVELTQGMGYELAVTQWTVDELRTSLRAAERRLTRLPLPRQDLAELMTMRSGENQITKAYWMKYRNEAIQPKDFLDYYSHVEALLRAFEVSVVTEGCVAVDQDREAIAAQLALLDRSTGFRDKDDLVKEHDVKHRLLVERLRGSGHVVFSNARYWFLTRDTKLPRYAIRTLDDGRVDLPFCVATSSWAQVMRAFTARTEDFDLSLVELLATPYLRYRVGPGVSPEVVNAVVARITQYQGATASLAAEVLADTALTEEIAVARDGAERDEVIENAFVAKVKEFEERALASEKREAELRAERSAAEEAARLAKVGEERVDQSLRDSEAAAERVARDHERALVAAEEQRKKAEELEREREADRAAHAERESELRRAAESADQDRSSAQTRSRLMLASLIGVLAVLCAVAPLVFSALRTTVWICLAESLAALGISAAIGIAFGRRHGPRVLAFLFGAASVVGLIVTIVIAARG